MLFFLDGHRPDWNVFRCTEHAWLTSKYIVSFLSFHFGVFVFNMTLNCRSIEQKKEKKNNYAVFWLCVITWMSKTNYSRCTNAICCLAKLRKKEINVYSWKENYCFILCFGIVKSKKVKKKTKSTSKCARSVRMLECCCFLLHCDLFVHYLWMLSW